MARSAKSARILKNLGYNIRKLRTDQGWTLEHTEEHGELTWQTIQKIESGKRNVTLNTLIKLSEIFKVSIAKLLEDVE